MTLEELYALVGGNYDQAVKVMRKEKLIDRHVRKFRANTVCEALMAAGESMDATALYENAHALKGVCANLGFDRIATLASDVTEEFRPGNERRFADEEVRAKLAEIDAAYRQTIEGIRRYEDEQPA